MLPPGIGKLDTAYVNVSFSVLSILKISEVCFFYYKQSYSTSIKCLSVFPLVMLISVYLASFWLAVKMLRFYYSTNLFNPDIPKNVLQNIIY